MKDTNEVTINGIVYVPKTQTLATSPETGLPYVIIRTYSAGVHAGYLYTKCGKGVTLFDSRRIWYWDGAASLSQMALSGVSKPQNCKFSVVIPKIELTEAIEVLYCTEVAKKNIQQVPEWKA